MATKSTAVHRVAYFDVHHPNGSKTRMLDVAWTDPSNPHKSMIERFVWPQAAAEFIILNMEVKP